MAINYIGLTPHEEPQWFKDRVILGSEIAIPTGAGLNKVLTSDADGKGTWQTPSGGDWVLLSTATASASSTIDFTGITSAYSMCVIVYENVVASINGSLIFLRVGTGGGPTYQTGASDYAWGFSGFYLSGTATGTTATTTGDGDDDHIRVGTADNTVAAGNSFGRIYISNPSNATLYKDIQFTSTYVVTGTPLYVWISGEGYYKSATAVTALRLYPDAGTFTTGNFYLFGLQIT